MAERVQFYFDPICPWCYQTARWIWRLVELGQVEVDWAVFSLSIANRGNATTKKKGHFRSERALRTVVAVRAHHGPEAVGGFYRELGRRVHECGEPLAKTLTVAGALTDAGLDATLGEQAMSDDATTTMLETEHAAFVERTGSIGVPTIVLDGGAGPSIFGPVVSRVPPDSDALELWQHVSWLVRHPAFAELKRNRIPIIDLVSESRKRHRRTDQR